MTSRMSTRLLRVGGHEAEQFLGVVSAARAPLGPARRRRAAKPSARDEHRARSPSALGVVLGHVLGQPRDARVHLRAAELLVGRDLAGRGLQQRRPGEEGARRARAP